MSYHWKFTEGDGVLWDSDDVLSLRRVEKLEVMTVEDFGNSDHTRKGHSELVDSVSPTVYVLVVTKIGGGRPWFPFPSEEMANRIAKAMLHAVELCGGGSKEPF